MSIPLSTRLRPTVIDDVVGQPHLLSDDSPFKNALKAGLNTSIIFWGPPGTGKTTLARIVAQECDRHFHQLSAVTDGLPALRKFITEADNMKRMGLSSLLFVDEIHRWNKAQQDALLPHVESGLIMLIGATTENPSFSLNPALRSRCWILPLNSVEDEQLLLALKRATQHPNGIQGEFSDDTLKVIVDYASGDVRRALSILERLSIIHEGPLTPDKVHFIIKTKDLLHDAHGNAHHNVVSAFIKSMRGSDPDAAVYWMARMLEGGEDPRFLARRMVIFASEDIGNADLRALPLAMSTFHASETIGMPELRIILGQCCIFLACAPKSNASYKAINAAIEFVKKTGALSVPTHIGNPPVGYKYPHDFDYHIVGQSHWPDKSSPQEFYIPTDHGDEKTIKARLKWWAEHLKSLADSLD